MQQIDKNNINEKNIDVPYYTRDLSKEGKYQITPRIIKSNNIILYRRMISTMNYDREFFQTKAFTKTEVNASKLMK